MRLCDAAFSGVFRFDGERNHFVAHAGLSVDELVAARAIFPLPAKAGATGLARVVLDRTVVHIPDVRTDPEWQASAPSRSLNPLGGYRTFLAVPLIRDAICLGAINVWRREVRAFSEQQVELLRTFADQAVIAIENVRLFEELGARNRDLTEALDQQTATAEILRTIAHAQSDAQPVFDTIVRSAARLCKSLMASVLLTDGRMLYLPANYGSSPEALAAVRARFPIPLDTATVSGVAIVTRSVVNVPDVEDPSVAEFTRQAGRVLGYRSLVTVPMRREGEVVGAINVCRREPGRFSDVEVALLQTFADQAVIAIENVRLFTELQARNADLTTALEKQTATSEILHVISRSPTDVQPVFDAIVGSAVRLMGAYSGGLTRISSDQLVLGAITSTDPSGDDVQRTRYPQPLDSDDPHAQAIRSRVPLNVADAQEDPRFPEPVHVAARARGFRSLVAVPLLRHDEPLGAITVTRRQAGGFTDDEIALLETFADQAVIAIENVRLFKELEDRNSALTEAHAQVRQALDRQTATADILRVISQSQAEVQPVFDAISTTRCVSSGRGRRRAAPGRRHAAPPRRGTRRSARVASSNCESSRRGRSTDVPAGRCVADRTVVHLPDPEADPALDPAIRILRARVDGDHALARRCCAKGNPSAPLPSLAPRPVRFRPPRSRCFRPLPIRR